MSDSVIEMTKCPVCEYVSAGELCYKCGCRLKNKPATFHVLDTQAIRRNPLRLVAAILAFFGLLAISMLMLLIIGLAATLAFIKACIYMLNSLLERLRIQLVEWVNLIFKKGRE